MLSAHRLLGQYRLVSRIASGGVGEIYLAEDTRINRQVAIKVMRVPVMEQASIRLFQREILPITRLNHPHILPLFDVGEEKDGNTILIYMVMPYLQEGSLVDWLRKRERLTPYEMAHFVMQAADALQYAHDHYLVHQNVKPSNFLVRERTGNMLPDLLLMDFGVAKILSNTATTGQYIVGTPIFMAPEQYKSQPQTATDQYALAVVAYLLLTGRAPFSGNQIMHQQFTVQPQPARSLNPAISPALDEVILRGLEKEPDKRFPTIFEFAQAFQQASDTGDREPTILVSGEPETPIAPIPPPPPGITAETPELAPPTPPYLIAGGKSSGISKPRLFLLLSIALLIIVASIVGGTGFYVNYWNQRHASATATANAATSQAITGATATAQANATATVQVGMTATAQANSYPSYLPGNGTLAFVDPLSQPDNRWDNNSDSAHGGASQFTQGAYHVSQSKLNYTYESNDTAASDNFSNFAFEVQMTISKGDCGRIGFRADSTKGSGYFFEVCRDGSYALFLYPDYSGNNVRRLARGTSTAIRTGYNQANVIAVVANGSSLNLFVNNRQIDSANDATYSHGTIFLCAKDYSNPTEVVYSNARVWTL